MNLMPTMVVLLAVAWPVTGSFAAGEVAQPPLPDTQRVRLEEAFHLAETLGPRVWPAFDGKEAPVLLIVGDWEYLLNRETAPEGFGRLPDRPFRERPLFGRARVLSPALLATFPAVGFDCVVVGTAEQTGRSPVWWTLTLTHEMFHVFQGSRGLDQKVTALGIGRPGDTDWHLNFPFPYADADVERAVHLLGYSLYRAATLPEDAAKETVTYEARVAFEALTNLFALLDARYDDRRNADYLRYQTAKEGVARYVEYRLAEAAAHSGYAPLPAFAAAYGEDAYVTWSKKYDPNLLFQIKHAGHVSNSRLEFYSLGLGIALVLDRLDPTWKQRYFEAGVWGDDLLEHAVGDSAAGCPRLAH